MREDTAAVDALVVKLESSGIRCWVDRPSIAGGALWEENIRRALQASTAFAPCFSSAFEARATSYMRTEMKLAASEAELRIAKTGWILPILLERRPIPDFMFAGRALSQFHFLRSYNEDIADDVANAIRQIQPRRHDPVALRSLSHAVPPWFEEGANYVFDKDFNSTNTGGFQWHEKRYSWSIRFQGRKFEVRLRAHSPTKILGVVPWETDEPYATWIGRLCADRETSWVEFDDFPNNAVAPLEMTATRTSRAGSGQYCLIVRCPISGQTRRVGHSWSFDYDAPTAN
jgi:hypothetical protein